MNGHEAERLAYDRLRAALPDEYRLYPNIEWVGRAGPDAPAYDGEADIIVAHPDLGILCLEVKAGEPTKDASGKWWIGGHQLSRSPFIQAEDSKHALVKQLTELADWPRNHPPYAGHGVVLPGADLASLPARACPARAGGAAADRHRRHDARVAGDHPRGSRSRLRLLDR